MDGWMVPFGVCVCVLYDRPIWLCLAGQMDGCLAEWMAVWLNEWMDG